MSRFAHIADIKDGVVFSDPWYDGDVWCQYRSKFSDRNWFMSLSTSAGEYNTLQFQMLLGRPTLVNSVKISVLDNEGVSFKYPSHHDVKDVELGIDTACIYIGNTKNFEYFGESIALETGGDGGFGDLFVFNVKGEAQPSGFLLFGAFDKDFMEEERLFQHLVSSFDGKAISKDEFNYGVSPENLANKMVLAKELRIAGLSASFEKGNNEPVKKSEELTL